MVVTNGDAWFSCSPFLTSINDGLTSLLMVLPMVNVVKNGTTVNNDGLVIQLKVGSWAMMVDHGDGFHGWNGRW